MDKTYEPGRMKNDSVLIFRSHDENNPHLYEKNIFVALIVLIVVVALGIIIFLVKWVLKHRQIRVDQVPHIVYSEVPPHVPNVDNTLFSSLQFACNVSLASRSNNLKGQQELQIQEEVQREAVSHHQACNVAKRLCDVFSQTAISGIRSSVSSNDMHHESNISQSRVDNGVLVSESTYPGEQNIQLGEESLDSNGSGNSESCTATISTDGAVVWKRQKESDNNSDTVAYPIQCDSPPESRGRAQFSTGSEEHMTNILLPQMPVSTASEGLVAGNTLQTSDNTPQNSTSNSMSVDSQASQKTFATYGSDSSCRRSLLESWEKHSEENRKIYEILKSFVWVANFCPEGDTIEVFVRSDLPKQTVLNELRKSTGFGEEKFVIKYYHV